jgi:hypothetical protein
VKRMSGASELDGLLHHPCLSLYFPSISISPPSPSLLTVMKAGSSATVNSSSTNHHQPNQQHPSPTQPEANPVRGASPRTRTTTTTPGDDHSELILVGDRSRSFSFVNGKYVYMSHQGLTKSIPKNPASPFSQRTLFALQERKIAYRFQVRNHAS